MKRIKSQILKKHNRRQVEAWSSLGLFILGITVLCLWFINMPLFFVFVAYVATIYFLIEARERLLEIHTLSKEKIPKIFFIILNIVSPLEIVLLIIFQIHNYISFLLLATFYAGLYFAWSMSDCLAGVYQIKKQKSISTKIYLYISVITLIISGVIFLSCILFSWFLFVIVIGIVGITYGLITIYTRWVIDHSDRNEIGY